MSNKRKPIVTRTAGELAGALGLSPLDGAEIEVRATLTEQIVRIARRSRLTHAHIAKAAGTSRTRVTAILNRNTHGVSTDLLLRLLAALGYRARLTVRRVSRAA
jgi:predicted XRE-type DNA-binding protein